MSKIRLLLFFRGVAAQQGIASSHTGHRHSDNRWPRPRNTLTPKTGTAASRITIRLLDKKAAPGHVVKPPARHVLGVRENSPNIQNGAANNKQLNREVNLFLWSPLCNPVHPFFVPADPPSCHYWPSRCFWQVAPAPSPQLLSQARKPRQ